MGFIIGREARDNSIRAIQQSHWPVPVHILGSTKCYQWKAEKMFDHVEESYLRAVLEALGLGPHMFMALYSTPSAQVKGNGIFSSMFSIRNGTRQECPLSPLLFTLVFEPLLRTVQASLDIKDLKVGNTEHKLSAYADDVLFHLTH